MANAAASAPAVTAVIKRFMSELRF
jgi:hypothetical protein